MIGCSADFPAMTDLFSGAHGVDVQQRPTEPMRELGAYEALWARDGASFKSLATIFRNHPGSVPSDFVPPAEAEGFRQLALAAIREAGIQQFGIRLQGAGEYPARLRDALHPVELLYYQGDWDITSTRCVAIVGTRHPSGAGQRRASRLARCCVGAGFTVVSGLAQGIDTAAHSGAIEAGGLTVAVLGTPITTCYPPQNRSLQEKIAADHLLISQVPIVRHSRQGIRGNRLFFPERNATMSALSAATVIVEAGNTSGCLIQARHAIQQGRKLFILDSCFGDPALTWPARFLERGALRVAEFDELISRLAS
jgi:DNA processing protein